jgi:putative Mg2+ transporter-C (MgtC) family protein
MDISIFHFEVLDLVKITAAFAAGALLGIEREYKSKSAGFRTMIIICIGSCMFTILSASFAENQDRIASNIVTGIGFLGAGVIFKESFSVRGITSAATIWIAAAIGMAIGLGYYAIAFFAILLVLATLVSLMKFQQVLNRLHQIREYKIQFLYDQYSVKKLEEDLKNLSINFVRNKLSKEEEKVSVYYQIEGNQYMHERLNEFLINTPAVSCFET